MVLNFGTCSSHRHCNRHRGNVLVPKLILPSYVQAMVKHNVHKDISKIELKKAFSNLNDQLKKSVY